MVLVDLGARKLDPRSAELVRRRCPIVPSTQDDANRLRANLEDIDLPSRRRSRIPAVTQRKLCNCFGTEGCLTDMCGIAGAFGVDAVDHWRIETTLGSLSRRGPDANGWHKEILGNTIATLLHTRLAIIDLDPRANQPLIRDGLALVFNGEIYNYLEIGAELRARGHKLTTASDTEVLLEAYRAWGLRCLDKLEGMWAFALLDAKTGKLILCRIALGKSRCFI